MSTKNKKAAADAKSKGAKDKVKPTPPAKKDKEKGTKEVLKQEPSKEQLEKLVPEVKPIVMIPPDVFTAEELFFKST